MGTAAVGERGTTLRLRCCGALIALRLQCRRERTPLQLEPMPAVASVEVIVSRAGSFHEQNRPAQRNTPKCTIIFSANFLRFLEDSGGARCTHALGLSLCSNDFRDESGDDRNGGGRAYETVHARQIAQTDAF